MKALFTVFLGSTLFALPIGNPVSPMIIQEESFFAVDAGFYGDYVYNRHMKTSIGGNNVQTFQIMTNAGYIAAEFWNRVEFFATFGASSISFYGNSEKLGAIGYSNSPPNIFTTNDGFSWSVGGNGTVFAMSRYAVGFEGQYFQTSPDFGKITDGWGITAKPNNQKTKYREWQLGTAIVYYLTPTVFPYIGMSYSRANYDLFPVTYPDNTKFNDLPNMRNARAFAYSTGLTLSFYEQLNCTVEGRFAGELGLYLNGSYRF